MICPKINYLPQNNIEVISLYVIGKLSLTMLFVTKWTLVVTFWILVGTLFYSFSCNVCSEMVSHSKFQQIMMLYVVPLLVQQWLAFITMPVSWSCAILVKNIRIFPFLDDFSPCWRAPPTVQATINHDNGTFFLSPNSIEKDGCAACGEISHQQGEGRCVELELPWVGEGTVTVCWNLEHKARERRLGHVKA